MAPLQTLWGWVRILCAWLRRGTVPLPPPPPRKRSPVIGHHTHTISTWYTIVCEHPEDDGCTECTWRARAAYRAYNASFQFQEPGPVPDGVNEQSIEYQARPLRPGADWIAWCDRFGKQPTGLDEYLPDAE
jgi:hypothetical protein